MTTDDFEAAWRAAANADPGHATYPEAVPGYRAQRATRRRSPVAEGPRKRRPDPDALRAAEPVTRMDHGTGGMIVHWSKPEGVVPPADAPVTVDDIRQAMADIDQAVRAAAGTLATDDAVQALADAIAQADTKRGRRWYDPRTWWRR